ncbi:MAG: AAA family ATPase [Gammaproteobacteria bacterium]|nr:AAA family ATPase [Gammaproteobacteria bacterium]MBU1440094.1 AAA family ATPase [Gammaproteobacteria bacterium]MBU2287689.1 AAA family ATPase [Gammaproteobacteria bacterium]MBU2407346.1 AAA family ATPase [Gammaproteobacteria bacterium]
MKPTLVVFSGLPGTGKTSIARQLIARWPAVYLRIDAIEHALEKAGAQQLIGPEGYLVAYELARSNLALGTSVVADCVNPLEVTRKAWRDVAADTASDVLDVEIVCSDPDEHRRRVEGREADIEGFALPSWEAAIRREYAVWTTPRLVVDSAWVGVAEAAELVLESLLRRSTDN